MHQGQTVQLLGACSLCISVASGHAAEVQRKLQVPMKLLLPKLYVPGSKLPLFPYNRGWSSTQ